MRNVYRSRREIVIETLTRQFRDDLEAVSSIAGLHMTVLARNASVEEIKLIVERASEAGVEVQELAPLTVAPPVRAGILLGYGAIATANIREGLSRLRGCFSPRRASIFVA